MEAARGNHKSLKMEAIGFFRTTVVSLVLVLTTIFIVHIHLHKSNLLAEVASLGMHTPSIYVHYRVNCNHTHPIPRTQGPLLTSYVHFWHIVRSGLGVQTAQHTWTSIQGMTTHRQEPGIQILLARLVTCWRVLQ